MEARFLESGGDPCVPEAVRFCDRYMLALATCARPSPFSSPTPRRGLRVPLVRNASRLRRLLAGTARCVMLCLRLWLRLSPLSVWQFLMEDFV